MLSYFLFARRRGQWVLGHWSKTDPQKVMGWLYRTLRELNFEWKQKSVFCVKARYPAGLRDPVTGETVPSEDVVKVMVQLYKAPRNLFVLDLRKLYGEPFLYMSFCTRLLTGVMAQQQPDPGSRGLGTSISNITPGTPAAIGYVPIGSLAGSPSQPGSFSGSFSSLQRGTPSVGGWPTNGGVLGISGLPGTPPHRQDAAAAAGSYSARGAPGISIPPRFGVGPSRLGSGSPDSGPGSSLFMVDEDERR